MYYRPAVGVQAQHQNQPAGLVFAQKAAGPPADDDHRLMLLIGFHVYPGAVARIVPDKYLTAPHGVPRSVAGAAVDHDASGTHGVAHRVLCIAVYGNRTAAQIGAQRWPWQAQIRHSFPAWRIVSFS